MTGDPDSDEKIKSDASAPADGQLPPRDILDIDPVYEALAHSRRRYLCYTLLEDTEWSLTDLARKIAAWENDVPDHAVTEDQREAVYISLYHAHVPKLVDEDVIAFDDVTETITTAEHAEQVLTALEGIGASLDSTQEHHAREEMNE
jgi:hypothetical protein